ncbi:MAG: hypothetical protein FJW23_07420 [Acidimicrobiia bacterium]|nr:hypothetical protein [Acidimicrobiia bacterium]
MRYRIAASLIGAFVLAAMSVSAHHSFAAYWHMDRTVTIEGVVTRVRLVNPHPEMRLNVTEANGEVHEWLVTGRAPGFAIVNAGWTADTVPIGMKVSIEGNPSRREGARALAAGKITRADGSVVWFGGGGGIPQG